MNIVKNCRRLFSPFINSKYIQLFHKPNHEPHKKQAERNENYITSKNVVNNQKLSNQQQQKLKDFSQFPYIDPQDLRILTLCNAAFIGIIPFWAPINIGICLGNAGYILSKIGTETKNFLLLVNNNQMEALSAFRPLKDYLKINLTHIILLLFQCLILTTDSYEMSNIFNMIWIGISIKQSILPSYFYLLLIPLFISIFMNFFSGIIRSFVLGQEPAAQPESKKQQSG